MKLRVRPYTPPFGSSTRWCIERKHWWGWGLFVKGFYDRRDAEVEMANLPGETEDGR
jgi:hypothetical protein